MKALGSTVAFGWVFLLFALGCASTIPPAIAHGIAVVDSNTQTLGADYQAVLAHGAAALDTATRTRDLGLLHENALLTRHIHDWSKAHTKGE